MSASDDIKKLIEIRARRARGWRSSTKRDMTAQQAMKAYFDEIERAQNCSTISDDQYMSELERMSAWLHSRIQAIDAGAELTVNFNNSDVEAYGKGIKVTSIAVKWSEQYRIDNPGTEEMEIYDPINSALEELLGV